MELGHKPSYSMGYGARGMLPGRHVFPGHSVVIAMVFLLAVAVIAAVLLPGITVSSPWLQIAMLLAAVAIVPPAQDVVIVGHGPDIAVVSAVLASAGTLGGRVIHQAGSLSDVRGILKESAVKQVIVSDRFESGHIAELNDIRGMHPDVVESTDAVGHLLGRLPSQMVSEESLRQAITAQPKLYAFSRRAFDLAISLGLGLAILPFLPFIALAIRIDSPGSILYSQERVGLNGKPFRIYKFRSMRNDAERNGAVWAQTADPRVTRVGKVMRLTRIDELPQLWNVLRGDMSFIGPRPERPEFTSVLEQEIPGYRLRTLVKPGLTGWAQVSYRYTSSVHETRTKLEYDLYYVKHASPGLDLRILLRTIAVVVDMRGR